MRCPISEQVFCSFLAMALGVPHDSERGLGMMRTRAPVLVLGDYKSQPVGAEIIQDSARVFAGQEADSLLASDPVTEA